MTAISTAGAGTHIQTRPNTGMRRGLLVDVAKLVRLPEERAMRLASAGSAHEPTTLCCSVCAPPSSCPLQVSRCASKCSTEIGPYTSFSAPRIGRTMVWSPPRARIRGCSLPSRAREEVKSVPGDVGRLSRVEYATCISSIASAGSYGDTGISLQSIYDQYK